MSDLLSKKCIPCSVGAPPLNKDEIKEYMNSLEEGWKETIDNRITNTYNFKNFKEGLEFTSKVGDLAEKEGHHPTIELSWGVVKIRIWTSKIQGLHENDFILAAKIDEII